MWISTQEANSLRSRAYQRLRRPPVATLLAALRVTGAPLRLRGCHALWWSMRLAAVIATKGRTERIIV
jgi:hypothetical protein